MARLILSTWAEPISASPPKERCLWWMPSSLCAAKQPEQVWHNLVKAHPEIGTFCETYPFAGADPAVVVDAPGWSVIEDLLPAHVLS